MNEDSFNLVAPTSDSNGSFSFFSSDESVATISGSTVTTVVTGSTTITAIQAASDNYNVGTITAQLNVSDPIWSQVGSDFLPTSNNIIYGSISRDGTVVAVQISDDDTNGTNRGILKIFKRNGNSWEQRGGTFFGLNDNDYIGGTLSSDGNYVAIKYNDSVGSDKGKVGVYSYNIDKISNDENGPIGWSIMGSFIENEYVDDNESFHVNLSGDGQTVAVICPLGDTTNGTINAGSVRVFRYQSSGWSLMGEPIYGKNANDQFGGGMNMSADGNVLAVAATHADVDGHYDANNNNGIVSVYIWNSNSNSWDQRGTDIYGQLYYSWETNLRFANPISLSSDGNIISLGSIIYGSYRGTTKVLKWNSSNGDYEMLGQRIEEMGDWSVSGYAALSGNGKILAIGSSNNNSDIRMYQLKSSVTTHVPNPPTNMIGYQSGTTIYRMTITGNKDATGNVYGSNMYKADSPIAKAAVHAGVITDGETKEVYICVERFQFKHIGKTSNGVTSYGYVNTEETVSYYFMDSPKLWKRIGNAIQGTFVTLSENGKSIGVTSYQNGNKFRVYGYIIQ
jgi:hypothetical protein